MMNGDRQMIPTSRMMQGKENQHDDAILSDARTQQPQERGHQHMRVEDQHQPSSICVIARLFSFCVVPPVMFSAPPKELTEKCRCRSCSVRCDDAMRAVRCVGSGSCVFACPVQCARVAVLLYDSPFVVVAICDGRSDRRLDSIGSRRF